MKKQFSLYSVVTSEEQDSTTENFQFKVDQWKKQSRRRYGGRKNSSIQTNIDQQTLPVPYKQKLQKIEVEEEAPNPINEEKAMNNFDDIHFPRFSVVNQRNFTTMPVRNIQVQQRAVQQRIQHPQQTYDPRIPRSITPQYPIQAQQHQNAPDDSNHTLQYEQFFLIQRNQIQANQQQRHENDARYFNPPQRNPQIAANLMSRFPINYSQNILQAGIARNQVTAQHLITHPTQQPIRPNQPSQQIIKTYLNSFVWKAKWGLMPSSDHCRNIPLILDKSDRRFKFTEVNEQKNGQKNSICQWDDMNFENPKYYSDLYVAKDGRLDLNLRHSDPALNLTLIEPNLTDFENFHHPKFNAKPIINRKVNVTYKMEYDIGENGEAALSPFLKDIKSLSGRRGGIIIVEHTSESPAFIMNVGMASRLIVYWHKNTPSDMPKVIDENMHILEPDQTAPFIAQIPKNQPVPSINCLLYSVPIAQHVIEPTDFLLIKSISKAQFYIRPFNSIYCAGFIEPRQVVMRPATKKTQDFHMNFIKAILINIFRGTEQYPGRRRIQVSQIQNEFFPGVNEPKLRTVLREFAKFYREQSNGFWERKDINLDQKFQMIEITPEMVCQYQSMLVGQWKLRKNGVHILTRSKRVFQQIQNLHGELTKKVAEKIELELMKTPWSRTDNFSKAFQGHAVQIEHTEDGQQVVRSKSRRGKSGPSIDGKETTTVSKRQLAGTEADLRSLTSRELRDKLSHLGVSTSIIDSKTRWQQVALLRQLANRQKQDGSTSDITKNYSRGPRNDYAASLDAYKKQYQATFDNNLAFISSNNPISKDEFDDGNILDDIALQMVREDDQDEDDEIDESSLQTNTESKPNNYNNVNKGDPPQLVPYGIYTYPTKIDWAKYGFVNCPMRTIAKLITLSWSREDGLQVDIHWRRSPHQIESLMKMPSNVYADPGQKAPSTSEDLEEYILKLQRKSLVDKLRRTKQASRGRGPKTPVQSYLTVKHQLPIVNDTGGNNLTFHLTPEITKTVLEASERFYLFEIRCGKTHSKKKKSMNDYKNNGGNSDNDSDDLMEVTSKPSKRRISRQTPLVLFNEMLKKLLNTLIHRPMDEYWVFLKPVLKKDVPDYYNIVHNPMCFEDIERKANNLEYNSLSKFFSDVKLIEQNCILYNTGRNQDLVVLAEKMMKDFQKELQLVREELDHVESEIDPVFKNQKPL